MSIACATLMAMVAACGEKPAPPAVETPGTVSIVSVNPLIHELVQKLAGDRMKTRCLLSTPVALKHGDLPADGAMTLREADVVFMHAAEPFAELVKTIEGNVPMDRLVRVGPRGARGTRETRGARGEDAAAMKSRGFISFAPRDVLALLSEIETALVARDPKQAAAIRQEAATLDGEIEALASSMQSQLAPLPADRRIIITDDAAVASVIRGIGFEAVLFDRTIGVHPTVADRDALLRQIRSVKAGAIAIDDGGSETMRELLAEVAQETAAKVIQPSIRAWPGEGEGYVAWMRGNVEAIARAIR